MPEAIDESLVEERVLCDEEEGLVNAYFGTEGRRGSGEPFSRYSRVDMEGLGRTMIA